MQLIIWIISFLWIVYQMPIPVHSQGNNQPANSHLWIRCYDYLGCVNNTEEWYHRLLRPIVEHPLPRHIVKTTFILFKKGKDSRHMVEVEPLVPTKKQIKATSFDPRKSRIHLLIHDFTSNGMAGWIKHTAKSLLSIDAGNVISVDWTGGAEPPYSIAVQNARLVALEIVSLLRTLSNDFRTTPDRFYLIGQGLGAHVAGYVGQKINGVGRITGLDPVGLYFKDMPPITRLDPTDAQFVDVINTDIETNDGQGSGELYGHVNFFPNGGLTQPGCNLTSLYPSFDKITREMVKQDEVVPGCNHKRATKYFTGSIDERDQCTPIAYACKDYSSFKRGECTTGCNDSSPCASMGHFADINFVASGSNSVLKSTRLFLDTNDEHPYCSQFRLSVFPYRILIELSRDLSMNSSSQREMLTVMGGTFFARVSSNIERTSFNVILNTGLGKKPLNIDGSNVFLAYKKPPKLTKPTKVLLSYKSDNNDARVYVKHLEIGGLPENVRISAVDERLCGKDEVTSLKSGDEAEFRPCIDRQRSRVKESVFRIPVALRQRRNPEEKRPSSLKFLDVSDYDENEPPEPAEDDYYSNR